MRFQLSAHGEPDALSDFFVGCRVAAVQLSIVVALVQGARVTFGRINNSHDLSGFVIECDAVGAVLQFFDAHFSFVLEGLFQKLTQRTGEQPPGVVEA